MIPCSIIVLPITIPCRIIFTAKGHPVKRHIPSGQVWEYPPEKRPRGLDSKLEARQVVWFSCKLRSSSVKELLLLMNDRNRFFQLHHKTNLFTTSSLKVFPHSPSFCPTLCRCYIAAESNEISQISRPCFNMLSHLHHCKTRNSLDKLRSTYFSAT